MPKKLTTEEFIQKAKEVHGDRYDYSKTQYDGMSVPVDIICRRHGLFRQRPIEHIQGNGCQKCAMESRREKQSIPFDEFVRRAQKIHGDKYDYSVAKKEYNTGTYKSRKVTIICPEHGPFRQAPGNHVGQKQGCPVCGAQKVIDSHRMTMDEFLLRARQVHGWKYDYSKVNIKAPDKMITIICPQHGEFQQNLYNHLIQGHGCPKCAKEKKMGDLLDTFITRARKKFGDRFDYSSVVYGKTEPGRKITIVCRKHGAFQTQPLKHLRTSNGGCKECDYEQRRDTFLRTARLIHGDKYDYSRVNYINNSTKVEIICPVHGPFFQTPDQHRNHGCFQCAVEYRANKKLLSRDEYISRAVQASSPLLDFSESVFTGVNKPITVRCIRHGYFTKQANSILFGYGCPVCSRENRSFMLRLLADKQFLLTVPSNSLLEIVSMKRLPKAFYDLVYTQNNTEARASAIRRLQEEMEKGQQEPEKVIDNEELQTLPDTDVFNRKSYVSAEEYISALGRQESYQDRVSDFIKAEYLQNVWNDVLNGKTKPAAIQLEDNTNQTAKELLKAFQDEFTKVNSIEPDMDYRFHAQPTLLQKLIIKRTLERGSYANWSAMGSGKTLATLVASRLSGAKTTLILAPKDVIIQSWIPQIKEAYPKMKIYTNIDGINKSAEDIFHFEDGEFLPPISEGEYRSVLVNYDRFSYPDLYEKMRITLFDAAPEFVCLDEIQYIKSSATEDVSNRHSFTSDFITKLRKKNPLVKVSVLSGTPVINNLEEPRSIIGILTGESISGSNRVTVRNVHEAYRSILMNGFRYKSESGDNTTIERPTVNGNDILQDIARLNTDDGILPIERILAQKKISTPEILRSIQPGTIIYTTYVDGIVQPVMDAVRSLGYSIEEYTGQNYSRRESLHRFLDGTTDVLVASRPVILGIDGLQERSSHLLILSLPWTYADLEQLIARLNRPKKDGKRNDVRVTIPEVIIRGKKGTWSWDRRRLALIQNKRNLGEAIMDGYIEKIYTIDRQELLKKAVESIKEEEQ